MGSCGLLWPPVLELLALWAGVGLLGECRTHAAHWVGAGPQTGGIPGTAHRPASGWLPSAGFRGEEVFGLSFTWA